MNAVALIVGGFIGTLLRYAAGSLIASPSNGFPLGIWIINMLGSFFLGWFFTAVPAKYPIRPEFRLGLGTGVTGAFTTFSTFSVQTVHLLQIGHGGTAVSYVLLSVIGGLALAITGARSVALPAGEGMK